MSFQGNWDIYKCDECGWEVWLPPGQDIIDYPSGTNQTWKRIEISGETICPDCIRKSFNREE